MLPDLTALPLRSASGTMSPNQARLASHKGMISLRELQSTTGEELSALLPSVLDRATRRLPEDIAHYEKLVVSLREMIGLMGLGK